MQVKLTAKTLEDYIVQYDMRSFLNDTLLENLKIVQFPIYSTVCVEGAKQHHLYFLVEGQVQCSHYHLNGKLAVIALSNPFESIGDLEILDEEHLRSNVIATQPSIMLSIPKETVRQYGADDPRFLRFLLAQYRGKIYRSNALQVNQVLPLNSRLSLYMMSQLESDNASVILPAKEELASLMGTTIRHLNRVLRQLVESGYISDGYPLVQILDHPAMEQLAQS